jgi:two-component system KDP operon response regulator KdpE
MDIKETILIIEDDKAITKILSTSLEHDYKVIASKNLQDGHRKLTSFNPSLVLLDLGLPDGDGKEFIKKIRVFFDKPIIVVSARFDEKEIINCLDLGADDYVTKPFSIKQLLARIRSTCRRYEHNSTPLENRIVCQELSIDLVSRVVSKNATVLKLTPTEYNLLKFMAIHPNKVLTHQLILKEIWGVGYQNEMQYLRTYINSLRKKIEIETTRPRYIITESSIGYRFCCNEEEN